MVDDNPDLSNALTISEVSARINRVPHTIRQWQRDMRLPNELLPFRNENGWRVWTEEQVAAIKIWMVESDLRPGKGLDKNRKKENV